MDFNLVEMKSQTNQPSLAKPASGVKEFIKTLTGISQKIKLSEFHIIGEYRENEFIPGSYNFTIKGLYEVDNHRAIPFPEGYWLLMELMLAWHSHAALAPRLRELINSLISEPKIIKHYGRLISNSLVLGE